jgi:hypothetical protein
MSASYRFPRPIPASPQALVASRTMNRSPA